MSKILITGGTGFIGLHLAQNHLDRGDSVTIVDNNFKVGQQRDRMLNKVLTNPLVTMLHLHLDQPLDADRFSPHYDIVYHLAAINGTRLFYEIPYTVSRTNVLTTINLLDLLGRITVGRLIYTSSSEVYADGESMGMVAIPTAEDVPVVFQQPTNIRFSYGASKFMGEVLCQNYRVMHGQPLTLVRYHNIYGPRMGDKHVIPEFHRRLRGGESPFILHGGDQTRSFCYVADAVKATQLCAENPKANGEIVHIGNEKGETRIDDLARKMMIQMGISVEMRDQGAQSGSVQRRCPQTGKLLRLTGYSPATPLSEGLKNTIAWYDEIG